MITIKQLHEGLSSGEITIDENGHDPFYGWGPRHMLEGLGRKIEYFDDKTNKKETVWSDRMVNDRRRETDKHILDITMDSPCSKCGKHLGWVYNHDEKKIACVVTELNSDEKNVEDWYYEYDMERCEHEHNTPQHFEFDVNDKVIFANFFRDHMDKFDNEVGRKKYDEYSLNTQAGRKRICEYHAKDNIGYQQLGNTSVDIFLSNDKTEILIIEETIVLDEDYVDENGERGIEYFAKDEIPKLGYEYCGSVSCDMWRYMFGNVSNVKTPAGDTVIVEPKIGKYDVYNYYYSTEHYKHSIGVFPIASKIKLK